MYNTKYSVDLRSVYMYSRVALKHEIANIHRASALLFYYHISVEIGLQIAIFDGDFMFQYHPSLHIHK